MRFPMKTPTKDAKIDLHGLPVEVAKVAVQALWMRQHETNLSS